MNKGKNMGWLLIEKNSLIEEEFQKLVESGIPFVPELRVEKPRRISGVAFDDAQKSEVFDVLGLHTVEFNEYNTERTGVIFLDPVGIEVEPEPQITEEEKKKREEAENKIKRQEKLATRRRYVKECQERALTRINEAKSGFEKAESDLSEFEKKIVETLRNRDFYKKELEKLRNDKKDDNQKYKDEFDVLCDVEGVKKVDVLEGVINVYTGNIVIPYDSTLYDIGEFRIDIPTNGKDVVRAYNLTRAPSNYYHPHVRMDGGCCLGNLSHSITELISKYEFSIVAQVMIQYLCTVNPGDWYTPIENWPKKKKSVPKSMKNKKGKVEVK
jgi:hypothetical protein